MLKIEMLKWLPQDEEIVFFLLYGGEISQEVLGALCESLEHELKEHKVKLEKILTIFIELAQNILKASIKGDAVLFVTKNDDYFCITAINIVTEEEKNKIQEKWDKILKMFKDEIKKEYKRLRKEGDDKHEKGAGIGFYEIARKSEGIMYNFQPTKDGNYYYIIKVGVKS